MATRTFQPQRFLAVDSAGSYLVLLLLLEASQGAFYLGATGRIGFVEDKARKREKPSPKRGEKGADPGREEERRRKRALQALRSCCVADLSGKWWRKRKNPTPPARVSPQTIFPWICGIFSDDPPPHFVRCTKFPRIHGSFKDVDRTLLWIVLHFPRISLDFQGCLKELLVVSSTLIA